ncbi:MAG: disulfide bond formation protein B [Gammaproteobacteria bacterium]|nr:disulfide bond formation protein B [Gammaproteobacteria bacterium]
MKLPNQRVVYLAGFAACAGMMAYALYAEHKLMLMPCPLCVFQRMAVIALGIVFLAAALQNPQSWGRRVYALLIALASAAGISVAGRHVWLQNLPEDQVPACGPGFDYIIDSFPLAEALRVIFSGSGECATVDWQFLGLSMPAWVLIAVAGLGVAGLWNSLRRA